MIESELTHIRLLPAEFLLHMMAAAIRAPSETKLPNINGEPHVQLFQTRADLPVMEASPDKIRSIYRKYQWQVFLGLVLGYPCSMSCA